MPVIFGVCMHVAMSSSQSYVPQCAPKPSELMPTCSSPIVTQRRGRWCVRWCAAATIRTSPRPTRASGNGPASKPDAGSLCRHVKTAPNYSIQLLSHFCFYLLPPPHLPLGTTHVPRPAAPSCLAARSAATVRLSCCCFSLFSSLIKGVLPMLLVSHTHERAEHGALWVCFGEITRLSGLAYLQQVCGWCLRAERW
jgi:hypothetical protein